MPGRPMGNITKAAPISNVLEHAGGQGGFAMEGTEPADKGSRMVVILEDDVSGTFKPSGDAVLHSVDQRITFVLPPCNIRARINTDADDADAQPFVSP